MKLVCSIVVSLYFIEKYTNTDSYAATVGEAAAQKRAVQKWNWNSLSIFSSVFLDEYSRIAGERGTVSSTQERKK